MAFNNIYDLYNSTLAEDKPFVDNCLGLIKTEIETRTNANQEYRFDFDLETIVGAEPELRKGRIRDQVVFILRSIGIHCTTNNNSYVLSVQWYIRDNREFMKAFY